MKHDEPKKILGISQAWLAVASGALFYCYQFILRVAPNVMHDELMRDLAINATGFGTMISLYSWSYAIIQIPLGIALDRYDPAKLLGAAALTCAASCFLFSASTSVYLCSISLFLMGLGSACGFIGCIKLATIWFPPAQLARVVALILVCGTVGASFGGIPLSALVDAITWQTTMQLLGSLGIVLGLLIFWVSQGTDMPVYRVASTGIFKGLIEVLKSSQAWLIALYGMLVYVPITILGTAWGVPFVQSVFAIDEKVAAAVTTTLFVGAAIGNPCFSFLSERLHRRVHLMALGAISGTIVYSTIIFLPATSLEMMFVLFFLAGFTYAAKALSFTAMCEIMPNSSSGVAVGFINTITMGIGALLHPLVGKLLVFHWDGLIVNGEDVYSQWDYRFALSVIPISLCLSILIVRYIRETYVETAELPTRASAPASLRDARSY